MTRSLSLPFSLEARQRRQQLASRVRLGSLLSFSRKERETPACKKKRKKHEAHGPSAGKIGRRLNGEARSRGVIGSVRCHASRQQKGRACAGLPKDATTEIERVRRRDAPRKRGGERTGPQMPRGGGGEEVRPAPTDGGTQWAGKGEGETGHRP